MFLRLKTYMALVEKEATASAFANSLRSERNHLREEAVSGRKEIKRLTDVIIHLKDQGMVVPPGFGDPVWGKYVMGDEAEVEDRSHQPPTADEREAAIGDAEFSKELEDALSNE